MGFMDAREITSVKVIIPFFFATGNAPFWGQWGYLLLNANVQNISHLFFGVNIDKNRRYFLINDIKNKIPARNNSLNEYLANI